MYVYKPLGSQAQKAFNASVCYPSTVNFHTVVSCITGACCDPLDGCEIFGGIFILHHQGAGYLSKMLVHIYQT
jgi:hypothetical protein